MIKTKDMTEDQKEAVEQFAHAFADRLDSSVLGTGFVLKQRISDIAIEQLMVLDNNNSIKALIEDNSLFKSFFYNILDMVEESVLNFVDEFELEESKEC
jgi:hypothetical protein